jgi:hypothetical protein
VEAHDPAAAAVLVRILNFRLPLSLLPKSSHPQELRNPTHSSNLRSNNSIFVRCRENSARANTPAPLSDDQLGLQPFESYHGGAIDAISLSTGTLNIKMPFLTYPQRGKLQLSFDLLYNNQWQHRREVCLSKPDPPLPACLWLWGHVPWVDALPLERSDFFVAPAQQVSVTGLMVNQQFGTGTSVYQVSWGNWSLQTADGSKHPLGNQGTLIQTGSNPDFYTSG